jgi:ArsR family transcriptional regulator, arsenate/arsenite/antimonite-responsive transcriptional repressor
MPKTLPLIEDSSPLCCPPLTTASMVAAEDALAISQRLKALADPTRIQLVSLLLSSPAREACTCELAPAVELSEPTVSHHLKQLLEAGIVTKQRQGMNVYYRLVPESLQALARVLDVDCC